jgi:hypothetical protein
MENVIIVPTPKFAFGLSVLRSFDDLAAADAIEMRAAAAVERTPDGRWYLPRETENGAYRGTIAAGALGALVELLSGPAGLLLGGVAVVLMGSSVEISEAEEAETIVHALARLVPPEAAAVIAEVYETGPAAMDEALVTLGLTAWRMNRAEAEAQVAARLSVSGRREAAP